MRLIIAAQLNDITSADCADCADADAAIELIEDGISALEDDLIGKYLAKKREHERWVAGILRLCHTGK